MEDISTYISKSLSIDNQYIYETGETYTLGEKYKFAIFRFNDFDLDEAFKTSDKGGLYCFTTECLFADIRLETGCYTKAKRVHSLFYLGKTDNFSTRQFDNHEHFDKFKALKISNDKKFLGIYICKKEEDPKDIESEILGIYNFEDNVSENKHKENCPMTIQEN